VRGRGGGAQGRGEERRHPHRRERLFGLNLSRNRTEFEGTRQATQAHTRRRKKDEAYQKKRNKDKSRKAKQKQIDDFKDKISGHVYYTAANKIGLADLEQSEQFKVLSTLLNKPMSRTLPMSNADC
jgi:hypothetical protein